MLRLTWTENALQDLEWWAKQNPKILKRIVTICLDACKTPTTGIGRPEPLRFNLTGYWSRRITQEHRIVYAFDGDAVTIIQCRFHYHK